MKGKGKRDSFPNLFFSLILSYFCYCPVSNTVVNRIYQSTAIAIGITFPPLPNIANPIPEPSLPNSTEPGGPDERCLFNPSLPHFAANDDLGRKG